MKIHFPQTTQVIAPTFGAWQRSTTTSLSSLYPSNPVVTPGFGNANRPPIRRNIYQERLAFLNSNLTLHSIYLQYLQNPDSALYFRKMEPLAKLFTSLTQANIQQNGKLPLSQQLVGPFTKQYSIPINSPRKVLASIQKHFRIHSLKQSNALNYLMVYQAFTLELADALKRYIKQNTRQTMAINYHPFTGEKQSLIEAARTELDSSYLDKKQPFGIRAMVIWIGRPYMEPGLLGMLDQAGFIHNNVSIPLLQSVYQAFHNNIQQLLLLTQGRGRPINKPGSLFKHRTVENMTIAASSHKSAIPVRTYEALNAEAKQGDWFRRREGNTELFFITPQGFQKYMVSPDSRDAAQFNEFFYRCEHQRKNVIVTPVEAHSYASIMEKPWFYQFIVVDCLKFNTPVTVAKALAKLLKEKGKTNIHLLDVAAGTGLQAQTLREEGINGTFTAIEPVHEPYQDLNVTIFDFQNNNRRYLASTTQTPLNQAMYTQWFRWDTTATQQKYVSKKLKYEPNQPDTLIISSAINRKDHLSPKDFALFFNCLRFKNKNEGYFSFDVNSAVAEDPNHPLQKLFNILKDKKIIEIYRDEPFVYRNKMDGNPLSAHLILGRKLKNIDRSLMQKIDEWDIAFKQL